MGVGKFTPAQMQRAAAQTQKMKNAQVRSTARYIMSQKAAAYTPDIFAPGAKKQNPAKNPVVNLLAGIIKK